MDDQCTSITNSASVLFPPQGLPVFYAPGEAEAVCAALSRAGCVDGCGSNDSDCLVYGAEAVYHTLKLSVRRFHFSPSSCCLPAAPALTCRLWTRAGLHAATACQHTHAT